MQDAASADDSLKSATVRLASSAAGLVRSRLELASVELAETLERLHLRLTLMLAGVLLLLFGALGAGALVVVYFWETHRLWAIAVPSMAFAGIGLYLLHLAAKAGREGGPPFAATLAEFDKDRAALLHTAQAPVTPGTNP